MLLKGRILMKVRVINEKCIGCGSCISVTDEKIFDFSGGAHPDAVAREL